MGETIARVRLAGGDPTVFDQDGGLPQTIALDADHIYCANRPPGGPSELKREHKNGGDRVTLYVAGGLSPINPGIDVAVDDEAVYLSSAAGRRMPDLDLRTDGGTRSSFTFLHEARPILLDLKGRSSLDLAPWADRVRRIEARYEGPWELPVIGAVSAPAAVLIRPDGYVAWVGTGTDDGLHDATKWFGPPVPPSSS